MNAWEQVLGGPAIEVVAKATRRRFTVEYNRKIVREADGCKTPGAAGHRPHVCRPRAATRDVLPSAPARASRAAAAAVASGPRRGGTSGGARAVAYAALRGPGAGRGLRHPARRRQVFVFRADDVSRPGRARRGAGAARAAPASRLCRPGATRPPAQRALELGH